VNSHELDPSVEVVHLRRLLDIQPGCLMRVGVDGTLLAANDAALTLLGVKSLGEALGRDITAWIAPDQRDRWKGFLPGVAEGSPSSIECDVTASAAEAQPTLFHGVPLPDHPDGVVSIAVAARVVSAQRQLEAVVGELKTQLAAAETARRKAEATGAQALADARQLEVALDEFAKRHQQAVAEPAIRHQLETSLQQAQQALAREQEALAQAQQALAQSRQALAQAERRGQEATDERDAIRRRLDEAVATCGEREAALRRLQAAHDKVDAAYRAATAERGALAEALREHAAQLEALADGHPSHAVTAPVDTQAAGAATRKESRS
jgi:hypothetical protein